MAETYMCDDCGKKDAEWELRKIASAPGKTGFHRRVCRDCLGGELANDTTSIVKISKSAEAAR